MTNGRDQCPKCRSRDTERTYTSHLSNRRDTKCHTCGNEWEEYTGPECPNCKSNHTKHADRGPSPHRRTVIVCRECRYNHSGVAGLGTEGSDA